MKNKQTNNSSWHSEPYVWLVISFPVLAILGSMITIWLAVVSDDGLVVDDYYRKGLEINRTLERDKLAIDYGIEAKIEIDQNVEKLSILLDADENFNYPDNLLINFMHATRKNYDRKIIINKTGDKTYQARLPVLVKGPWYIQIESDKWRLVEFLKID